MLVIVKPVERKSSKLIVAEASDLSPIEEGDELIVRIASGKDIRCMCICIIKDVDYAVTVFIRTLCDLSSSDSFPEVISRVDYTLI